MMNADFLIDSHCHLNMTPLKENIEEVVQQAAAQGVRYLQTICTDLAELPELVAITERYPQIFTSVGVHPSDVVTQLPDNLVDILLRAAEHDKVISFGETGLDYHYHHTTQAHSDQQAAFIAHIQAAQAAQLPVVVHTRNADHDTGYILAKEQHSKHFTGVLHCFTSSKELAKKALDLGFYISISGICTFKNAEELRQIIQWLPLDRLLIETDAPFLAPIPHRGKPNNPSYVPLVAQMIAEIKRIDFEVVAMHTTVNFCQLFSKAKIKV